jgi:hypothetical protein
MEDNNNSNIPQEPASEAPFDASQSTGSPTNENTYWEGSIPDTSMQDTSMQETTSVDPITTESSPQKKSHGKLVAGMIILLLLLSGATAAFAFQSTLRNSFALLTKSPAKYYAYVEKNAIHESVDELLPYLNFTTDKVAYDAAVDITFNREALDSIMQSTLGTSMADLETAIGLPIENMGLDALVGYDKGLVNETFGVRLNQVNLITIELFMDLVKQEILIRLPELSQAYLKQSLESDASISMARLETITAERTADLLKRYGNILVDHITQVELEKNNTLTLDTLSENCTKLTVTLTQKDRDAIALAFLEEAKEDDYIIDLLPMFNATKEEYLQAIDDAITELQNPSAVTTEEPTVQMLVYVDSRGYITGRELSMAGSPAAIGFTNLTAKDYNEYDYYVKDETGNTMIKGTGNQTKDQGANDGILTLEYNNPSAEPFSNLSFDIKYEDVRTETKNKHVYQYGSYTLSSLDLMGLQIRMDNSVAEDIQYNKIIFQMGASPLVTIDTNVTYLDDYAVTTPQENAEVYDVTQAETYIATLNVEEHLSKLSEQLGVDLNSLFGLFQNNLTIE